MKLPDVIKDTRAHILAAILASAWLLSHDAVHHNTCRLPEAPTVEQDICTATNSLAYQRFLRKHGLLPVSTSFQSLRTTLHSLTCSVKQLIRLLTGDEMFEGSQETLFEGGSPAYHVITGHIYSHPLPSIVTY